MVDEGNSKAVVQQLVVARRAPRMRETLAAVLQHWIRMGAPCSYARTPSQTIAPTCSRAGRRSCRGPMAYGQGQHETAETNLAYCDAACTIPELCTWASAAHSGASQDAIILAMPPVVGQFSGRRPGAVGTGDDSGFSGRAQDA